MSKSTRNSGARWTRQDVAELRREAQQNTPTPVIGLHLGRTPAAVQTKASEEGISVNPPNRSPYHRTK